MYSIIVVLLLSWSPAVNLGIPGVDDRFPQSVRWQAEHTCLVWQANLGGDWEIYSRFMVSYAPLFSDTFRITYNTTADMYPVVAYDKTRYCFWCAWMGTGSNSNDIFICQSNSMNGWSAPGQITDDLINDTGPSICVIRDTVWVAWYGETGSAYNIFVAFYNGTAWSSPEAITDDSVINNTRPKINGHYNHPVVVWERGDDIYYSERTGGVWQSPLPVTTDTGSDSRPEIAVQCYALTGNNFEGAWIFWYSDRDGDLDVYSTAMDTFDINRRVTFNPAFDYEPSPLDFIAVIDRRDPACVAFTTSRNSSYDIYALFGYFSWDTVAIDTNSSTDQLPCMSGGDNRIWTFWQTDRNGDDDICGSQMWVGGIEENAGGVTAGDGNILRVWPNPFTGNTIIKFQISNSKFQTTLRIYNVTGRIVKLFNHLTIQPIDQIIWDGTDDLGNPLAPGVYFCCLQQEGQVATTKLIKIK